MALTPGDPRYLRGEGTEHPARQRSQEPSFAPGPRHRGFARGQLADSVARVTASDPHRRTLSSGVPERPGESGREGTCLPGQRPQLPWLPPAVADTWAPWSHTGK